MKRWRADPTEENFWGVVLAYAGIKFKTYSGLPFSYEIKKGRNGEYTKELWIDRREKSKSLAWSSIVLALGNIKEEVVDRPKALGDIRGVTVNGRPKVPCQLSGRFRGRSIFSPFF